VPEGEVLRSEVHDFFNRCLDAGWDLEDLHDELEAVQEDRDAEEE